MPRHARQQRQRRVAYCQQQKGNGGGGEKDRKKGNGGGGEKESIQNFEVLIGDCLCLLCFALYKQVRVGSAAPVDAGMRCPAKDVHSC